MPNIFSIYEDQEKSNNPQPQENDSQQEQAIDDYGENINTQKETSLELSVSGDVSGDQEVDKQKRQNQFTDEKFGAISSENNLPKYNEESSWSPEYSDRGFMEEVGTSIMRGVGKHIIKGTGDLLQMAGGLISPDYVKGNMLSHFLQNSGEEFAGKFKSYIPKELQPENLKWSSILDSRFWSTHIAEMIPQLAEFIFLSHGGSSLAKNLAGKALKKLPGASKVALGRTVEFTGKGVIGKLATEAGLTTAGKTLFGTVGGGVAGNFFSGLLNSAEIINSNKDLKYDNGENVFNEDELRAMATENMKQNAKWMALDIASWGITYGGAGKYLKKINPIAKGKKIMSAAEHSKAIGKAFSYQLSPIIKGLGRYSKHIVAEGVEEMFQESWEEWSKKKAYAKITGEEMPYKDDFFEFFNSKENKATKIISAAMGGLGAGVFNIKSLINKSAEDSSRLYNRTKNLTEIINKQGTDKELEWNEFYKDQLISDLVIDGKEDLYEEVFGKMLENEHITEEGKSRYDESLIEYMKINKKAKSLNIKGRQALLYNNQLERYSNQKIEEYQKIAEENIASINEDKILNEKEKKKEISKIEGVFNKRLKAVSLLLVKAKQNQANLLIGKKADPLKMDIITDEYGNDIVTGGLSTEQMKEYVENTDNISKSQLKYSELKSGGKKVFDNLFGKLKKGKETLESTSSKGVLEGVKKNLSKAKEAFSKGVKKGENDVKGTSSEQGDSTKVADAFELHTIEENKKGEFQIKTPEGVLIDTKYKTQEEAETVAEDLDSTIESSTKEKEETIPKVTKEELKKISSLVRNKKSLTPEQNKIRLENKDIIHNNIVKEMLGIEDSNDNVLDDLNKNQIKDVETKYNVNIKKTENGFDIETDLKDPDADLDLKEEVLNDIYSKIEERKSIVEDLDLTEEEKAFMKEEAGVKKSKTDLKNKSKKSSEEDFKIDPKNLEDASSKIGLDKRVKDKNIRQFNVADSMIARATLFKLNNTGHTNDSDLSQNELDNYLNRFTTYNLNGPGNLHKMIVVNHHLKKMFPNTNDPAQVIISQNLFESVGSIGLGMSLGMTIYIDEKAWEQDKTYMHELSHIYFQLAKKEPETVEIIKKILLDKDLIESVKEKYDDYIQYEIVYEAGTKKVAKRDLFRAFGEQGLDPEMHEATLIDFIKKGEIKTVPLSQQDLILEEAFVAKLEGPLSNKIDKIFNLKSEPKRRSDVKIWWGMLRRKGEILEANNEVDKMLEKLFEKEVDPNDTSNFMLETFKAVTKGVKIDSYGLDHRIEKNNSEYLSKIDSINSKINSQFNEKPEYIFSIRDEFTESELDELDALDEIFEDDGTVSYNQTYVSKLKRSSRLLRRFGVVYNKTLRAQDLLKTKDEVTHRGKVSLLHKDLFEHSIADLATENKTAAGFIHSIENSEIKEIAAFNRFLNKMFPSTKYQVLNSMHFVTGNAKHITGYRNIIDSSGNHTFIDSISQKEETQINNIIESLKYAFDQRNSGNPKWNDYQEAVKDIFKDDVPKSKDIAIVLNNLYKGNIRNLQGRNVTYRGMSIPTETLIVGYIKKGLFFNRKVNKDGFIKLNTDQVYFADARPIVTALIASTRGLSAVKNAEGNMEPLRIVNNHLTKEVDNMISYMRPDVNGKYKTKEEFLKRFGHLSTRGIKKKGSVWYNEDGTKYVPNQFLESLYDKFKSGSHPAVIQYHGLEDINNKKSSLYKNSSSLEQTLEDFLTFVRTSRKPNGGSNKNYLANIGTFSDSPRKFFMTTKKISFEEVFDLDKNGKPRLKRDGKILNSIFSIHNKMYEDAASNNRKVFNKMFKKALNDAVKVFESNHQELSKISVKTGMKSFEKISMNKYFAKNGKLNKDGVKLVAEYTINNIVNGYNLAEVFAPNVKGKDIVKRFKLNTSPVFSVRNENFKIEPIFFTDEIINNSISGTDSGMYILKEDAEMFQRLGQGLFDMNNGFKFLNGSVEKDNPKFKGNTAYLKGYTTIVEEGHPLYKLMKARKEKYIAFHKKEFNTDPSKNLNDGTPNHVVIAVPQSSDKSNFSPDKFTAKDAAGNISYTDIGSRFTEEYLSMDIDEAMKYYDDLYYDSKGRFLGIQAYNFGPQQLMDKKTSTVNTPVQMLNSIIVNATLNKKLELAYEIQSLFNKQKQKNMLKVLKSIKSANSNDRIEAYKSLIAKGLNKEDMDQAQRLLFDDDNSSIAHPYLVEIVTNQLAKTLRRAGNKLKSPGTYAHQKPDSSWRGQASENKALKGYGKNLDGTLSPAEIVLPKHMSDLVNARTKITVNNNYGKVAIRKGEEGLSKKQKEVLLKLRKTSNLIADLMILKFKAIDMAAKRHSVSESEAETKFIGEVKNTSGTVIGYYVKGDTVISSRVPSHGPSSTGVFEVIGFDKGEGNQAQVSSEFNDIIGSDNDGDALFVQIKSKEKGYEDYNKAITKMAEYWLSKDMKDQVTAKMDFDLKAKSIVKKVNEVYPVSKEYNMPFSPRQRMIDYNNTMVSKRSVGPVFNIHKIANVLASVNTPITNSIKIGSNTYGKFQDLVRGDESRNQQSAILANIILDNAKYGYADIFGLNEHNISEAVIMINLGIPLKEVALILNSPAAKLYSEYSRSGNSMFHESSSNKSIRDKVSKTLYYADTLMKRNSNKGDLSDYITKAKELVAKHRANHNKIKGTLNVDIKNIKDYSQQHNILELLSYFSKMNSDIQKVSVIMGGHNKIHVNPLVLEQQIKDFKSILFDSKTKEKSIVITDDLKRSPDMNNYLSVAEETLSHLKRINPVYQSSTNSVLKNVVKKIGRDLSAKEIEVISKDLLKFNTSRLLGLNNKSLEYVEKLLDKNPNNKESIYNKLASHISFLRSQRIDNGDNVLFASSMLDNSVLFKQALSMSLHGNQKYISANSAFTNASFNKTERDRAREEFEQLPAELKNDLILYDMITRGWKGPLSMAPFFDKEINLAINISSNDSIRNNNKEVSPVVLSRLEKVVTLKMSKNKNNPFQKIYLKNKIKSNNEAAALKQIFSNNNLYEKLIKGNGLYVNVIDQFGSRSLYELDSFTDAEAGLVSSENTLDKKKVRAIHIAKDKMKLIPYDLKEDTNIDLAIIKDRNTSIPFLAGDVNNTNSEIDFMKNAAVKYDSLMKHLRSDDFSTDSSMDAREEFYDETFARELELSQSEYYAAMEFKPYVAESVKEGMYRKYQQSKNAANGLFKGSKNPIKNLESKSAEDLISIYNTYGNKDVYAYSIILTPIVKRLSRILASEQAALFEKNGVKANPNTKKDISLMKAYLMSGSTIPSNHPAAQAMVRMMEKEYKNFINEKKRYTQKINKVTDALYKEKLGYGGKSGLSIQGIKNFGLRIKDALFSNRTDIYNKLYGNLVIREEKMNSQGKLVFDYRLRKVADIETDYKKGFITKAEKDFYNTFKEITTELMPSNLKTIKEDYIPHTSMNKLEMFSSRGLLGLMTQSRTEDHALYDVKMKYNGELVSWKKINDQFKAFSAVNSKLDTKKALEYRKLKQKAKKLLKSGLNEDGSQILVSNVMVETALGFGAINRFANNRSVKATELPSMDLNKALGDYIHSTLFVHGNSNFKGMQKLGPYIDSVMAWNQDNNLPNMNAHIKKVWKDYFLRQKRQKTFGPTTDRVILGLTRLNLFYALGYSANVNTGGLYAIGNVLSGKYHNIKDLGAGAWLKGETRFWGLDKGFEGGLSGIIQRRKRMSNIMKNLNFMDINVYDEVSMEKSGGLDRVFSDLALAPMIYSEEWIQKVHMLGLLTEEQLNKFDEDGNYKPDAMNISNEDLVRLEDRVKSSHGRGYQPTDQRAIQMYSWGNMMLQFSRFVPTMIHDRFANEDITIYGKKNIGTLMAVSKMIKHVVNNPKEFISYRNSLDKEPKEKLDAGLRGLAMATIISFIPGNNANSLFWDINYYANYPKLTSKLKPYPLKSIESLVGNLF